LQAFEIQRVGSQAACPLKEERRDEVVAKTMIADEVQVLRFFESGPIEKAEAVFNIVGEKMRERLQGVNRDQEKIAPPGSPRKRNPPGNQKAHSVECAEPNPQE
jgi:hypothetical protein